ncbi:MAG: TetR/AcrR family transcriptional regulator [Promethearchaeota archaeon]
MNDIVKVSGLSKGAIYHHFKSKEQLFISLIEELNTASLDLYQDLLSSETSAKKKLEFVADMVFKSTFECPKELCLIQLEFYITGSRVEESKTQLNTRYERIHEFVKDIIQEGVDSKEFRQDIDPGTMASILFATAEGLTLHHATLDKMMDSEKVKGNIMKMLFEGIQNI